MKLIIPMAGFGSRFVVAGYMPPKPLIKVDGKPIIEHVLNMFPCEEDVIFICNQEQLNATNLKDILLALKPKARIVNIKPHRLGPVYTVAQAFDLIGDDEPILMSYCDFTAGWDYEQFKKDVAATGCAGAVPCYQGFHPHLIHGNLYAGVLADERGFMTDIKEKHCFTAQLADCYQSCGIFYFNKGADVKKYFKELLISNVQLNGERYISMVYYLYKRDKLPVFIANIKHFTQWGTPEDLEEYEAWSRLLAKEANGVKGKTDIPVGREENVKITISPSSKEYNLAYQYWKDYFFYSGHHPLQNK